MLGLGAAAVRLGTGEHSDWYGRVAVNRPGCMDAFPKLQGGARITAARPCKSLSGGDSPVQLTAALPYKSQQLPAHRPLVRPQEEP